VTIFAFAATSFAIGPAPQSRIIVKAGNAPNLASGASHAAGNIANALGAWLGGLVISAGAGYASVNYVAVGLALAGLAIAVYAGITDVEGGDRGVVGRRQSSNARRAAGTLALPLLDNGDLEP
jgi:DHA1 family inner membrane transport protein